ncbi:receptor-type tyrosine-protein phosphatase N2 isoform X2 [Cavia porcellus]|uniref:receptor-type tyrosine-protein phosphatase N2 isoform X2 n=1 Tax=Cavia porcellus TaxID=10141 RepID=UPI002FE19533
MHSRCLPLRPESHFIVRALGSASCQPSLYCITGSCWISLVSVWPGPEDGMFGRCQKIPPLDTSGYEVSPAALQHLRVTLQALSHSGFTWQDDYIQRTMAQELAGLPRAPPQHMGTFGPARTSQQNVGAERQYSLEDDVALAKALQHYLLYLEALSHATGTSAHHRREHEKPPAKGEEPFPENILTYVTRTSSLSYPPVSQVQSPEALPLRTLGRLQPDELSPQADSSADRLRPMAARVAYTAPRPPVLAGESDLGSRYILRNPSRAPRPSSVLVAPQKWLSPPGHPQDPLSTGDEVLVQSLLKDLRRQQAGAEQEAPAGMEGMADMMASSARQDERPAEGQAITRQGAEGQPQELLGGREAALQGDRAWEDSSPGSSEASHLSVRLGDILQDHRSPLLPGELPPEQAFPTEIKKSEESVASLSSEEEDVGVENVKSQTYSKDLSENLKAEPRVAGLGRLQNWDPEAPQEAQSPQTGQWGPLGEGLQLEARPSEVEEPGYIVTGSDLLSPEKGKQLMSDVAHLLQVPPSIFEDIEVVGPAVTFKVGANARNMTTADVVKATADHRNQLEEASGLRILQSGTGPSSKLLPHGREQEDSTKFIVLTFLSLACIVGVLLASSLIYCLRHSSHHKLKKKLSGLGGDTSADATAAYQELCRQRMAVRPPDRPEGPHTSRISSVSSQFSDGPMPSPSARSSTSSWSEEPVQSNMDISTGHMILAYMEDHLQNKNRLEKEWEALCAYQAEPSSSLAAQREENLAKNRCPAVLTYDHSRILLKAENSHGNSDYINASPIMDHDPRNPAYITTQGPLPATVADFWQMVWESGCAVIVMLTPLTENGIRQCHHYWPDEGSNLYHIYEVNLVSEHIWCEDFLVRSFYLKNLQTHETRTVTQFHFLSWYDQGVPSSTRSLLDFRRKVNKCYRGRSCPIIVHCSDGAGRSGTYILIDMVLNKMAKGAKEIDIAATLEHLRDQRPGMVQTKEQFEFALTAVAEEVNAILRALPQ